MLHLAILSLVIGLPFDFIQSTSFNIWWIFQHLFRYWPLKLLQVSLLLGPKSRWKNSAQLLVSHFSGSSGYLEPFSQQMEALPYRPDLLNSQFSVHLTLSLPFHKQWKLSSWAWWPGLRRSCSRICSAGFISGYFFSAHNLLVTVYFLLYMVVNPHEATRASEWG